MNATEKLAKFIVETRLETIPGPVVHTAKRSIVDTIGVALAAGGELVAKSISAYVRGMSEGGAATVIGASLRTSPPWAALANGTLAHALDFDDTNWSMGGHASAAVLPAVLAQGEAQGASGPEIIEAFIIGFEVASKLGAGTSMGLYNNGWHPTSVLGTMGAAAAAAHLRGLDVETTRLVLGCAASQASGVRSNFGTMTKPLHAGLAAEAGVRAAGFVSAGITANSGILEAPIGYCVAFSGKDGYRLDEITGRLGSPYVFEKPGNNLKPYPCCMSAHASIDALRDLIAEEDLSAEGVERIDLALMAPNLSNLSYHEPKTGLEGKFSAEYTLARMLTDRALTLGTFTDEAVNEPAVRETMKKVHVHLAENEELIQGASRPITLTVQTGDGRRLEKRANISRGNAGWPLTDEEVRDKFRDCAGTKFGPEKTGEALSALDRLESASDIRPVMSLLA